MLVFLVMLVFLQNIRATLIPMLAMPVVLLGTFGVLSVFGYSINTLTMFAMVLAIGLLVDDAIVVVENVERIMREEGLPPREATVKSMSEITGALIGITTGAVSRVRADGVLRRLGRRHLPPVLRHHRLGHGALGPRRVDPDTGTLRHRAAPAENRVGRRRACSAGSTARSNGARTLIVVGTSAVLRQPLRGLCGLRC